MKQFSLLLILLLPFLAFTQSNTLKIKLTPKEAPTGEWQEATIKVLKQRYWMLGLAPQDYTIKPSGNSLTVICSGDVDPIVLQHVSTAKGTFRVMPIHKFDDERLNNLYQAMQKGKVRSRSGIQQLSDYFKINDYALNQHKYRRYPPAVLGMASADNIPVVNQFLNSPQIQSLVPADAKFFWSRKESRLHPGMYDLYLGSTSSSHSLLTSELAEINVLTKANHYGRVRDLLYVRMKRVDKEHLKVISNRNIDREVIALLDDYVLTAPIVEGPIETGEMELEGNFKGKEANLFRRMLMDLKLPCALQVE